MTIRETVWTPECGCVIKYTWDADMDEKQRTIVGNQLKEIVKDCGAHGRLSPSNLYKTVKDETGAKSIAFSLIEAEFKGITIDQLGWAWNPKRTVLSVTFPQGMSITSQNVLESKINMGLRKIGITSHAFHLQ